ncbi:hypothetical protein Ahy_A06g030231 isoform I [Arachis hypogaea]|uniref:Uncharacterized protein n=1 Tax=Arachis hypogaea TaxID=3818 RepID=A0A445CVP1_ARAHY|nr:hypothetical protein Ahy_A06g030231 isoform J [Arachis hypogaea]RYR54977.1 hypothetical protein Ahy_A06g030231 isoform C [Arachis hypogaea]RYR54978.1 hypothetical protein Ahy_A06g030231 isoform H [Arachis hypogaea]RYR54979.1 hypothetical protein Ahy_A06g030231 isoform I [Arachis hypogaea]
MFSSPRFLLHRTAAASLPLQQSKNQAAASTCCCRRQPPTRLSPVFSPVAETKRNQITGKKREPNSSTV